MKVLKSGEKVPASGIYRVLHSAPHAVEQREMFFEGSRLPECQLCPAGVLYQLESPCADGSTGNDRASCGRPLGDVHLEEATLTPARR